MGVDLPLRLRLESFDVVVAIPRECHDLVVRLLSPRNVNDNAVIEEEAISLVSR